VPPDPTRPQLQGTHCFSEVNMHLALVPIKQDTKFPVAAIPMKRMSSIAVRNAVHKRMALLFAWIFEVMATGKRPSHGFENEQFSPDSLRGKMAGTDFADG